MDINSFLYPEHFMPKQQQPQITQQTIPLDQALQRDLEVVDLKYIIENKPPTNIVRGFMKQNLMNIVSEEQELFGKKNMN